MKQSLADSRPVAMTTAGQYVELIKGAYDKWERQIKGEPSWASVDALMAAILHAINPEGSDG